ncbi:hypothetical protein ABPG75_000304 [Micractinium tetrahymenae]
MPTCPRTGASSRIPSIGSMLALLKLALDKQGRDLAAPVPPMLQQWCQAGGPEALLRRLAKEDAPVSDLDSALYLLCTLSSYAQGRVLSRTVLEAGCALAVVRLLCALNGRQRGSLDHDSFACPAGMLASQIETERA